MVLQHIPVQFAKLNGLNNRHCQMILRDQKQRSWPAELGYDRYHVYIRHGWREFRKANGLKEGDAFILKLIAKGKNPIMELHRGVSYLKAFFCIFTFLLYLLVLPSFYRIHSPFFLVVCMESAKCSDPTLIPFHQSKCNISTLLFIPILFFLLVLLSTTSFLVSFKVLLLLFSFP